MNTTNDNYIVRNNNNTKKNIEVFREVFREVFDL